MIEIAMVVLPGAFQGGVAAMLDSFGLASERRNRILQSHRGSNQKFDRQSENGMRLTLLSQDGANIPLGRGGEIKVDRYISESDQFNFIWVPAFRIGGVEPLTQRLHKAQPVIDWLAQQSQKGALIGASGSANALLFAANLDHNLSIPIVPALAPTFREVFPRIKMEGFREIVETDKVMLGRGISCDFELIARAFDRVLSLTTGNWLRSVLGSGVETNIDHNNDPLVETARLWLEQRFAEKISISALAQELHVSHVVLIRRFQNALGMPPSDYLKIVRLATAKRLLKGSKMTIESVSEAVGYQDARNFRQMFRGATGMSAREWRVKK